MNGVKLKPNFHQIWLTIHNISVKLVPNIYFYCQVYFSDIENGGEIMDTFLVSWDIGLGYLNIIICLYTTPSHYHNCANLSRHWIYKMPVRYVLSNVWVISNIFSQLSIIQYMGLCVFNLPISLVTVWQLRRYLPSTVLSRWRTRLSVSVQFSSIQVACVNEASTECAQEYKKCVETFWNTGRVVGNPGKAVRGVCRSALKRTVMWIWREGTCSSKYKPENGTCWMRTVLAVIWNWLKCGWPQLFFHSCLKYHQSISSEK